MLYSQKVSFFLVQVSVLDHTVHLKGPLFIHLEELCILVSYDFDIFEEDRLFIL